jgi:ketohexokinase
MNRVDHYPAEDEKLRAIKVDRRYGGNCPNTLEVLQQLIGLNKFIPVPLALFAVLPSSSSNGTIRIKSSFASAVDLTHCIYREAYEEPASSYIIRSRSAGSRTIVNYNGLPEMTGKEFTTMADQLGDKMTWCHFEASSSLLCASAIYYS